MFSADILMREVPQHLRRPEYEVFGSIIRSNATGKIVGHLQEAGMMSQVLSLATTNPVTGVFSLATDAIQVAQNEQIKSALESVQALQNVGLALGAASIGISLAGFAMLSHKISALEDEIGCIHASLSVIDSKLDAIMAEQWKKDCQRLRTLAEQLDETWFLSDGKGELSDITKEAHFLANEFSRKAQEALDSGAVFLTAIPFVESYALASAIRVTSRLAMDENQAALKSSAKATETMTSLLDAMQPSRAVIAQLQAQPEPFGRSQNAQEPCAPSQWDGFVKDQDDRFFAPMVRMRNLQAANASRMLTISNLVDHKISGREWLNAASAEQEAPLLFWEA